MVLEIAAGEEGEAVLLIGGDLEPLLELVGLPVADDIRAARPLMVDATGEEAGLDQGQARPDLEFVLRVRIAGRWIEAAEHQSGVAPVGPPEAHGEALRPTGLNADVQTGSARVGQFEPFRAVWFQLLDREVGEEFLGHDWSQRFATGNKRRCLSPLPFVSACGVFQTQCPASSSRKAQHLRNKSMTAALTMSNEQHRDYLPP